MQNNLDFRKVGINGLVIGSVLLLATLTACSRNEPPQVAVAVAQPAPAQAPAVIQDDYDYYPGYETYYSRNRHEYVYRDGNAWVRRPQPRGITVDVLLAAPSVRLDFHDSPERHHDNVLRSYPKNWKRPDMNHDDKDNRRDGRKDGDKRN